MFWKNRKKLRGFDWRVMTALYPRGCYISKNAHLIQKMQKMPKNFIYAEKCGKIYECFVIQACSNLSPRLSQKM
jgi:TPP-dependent indolepyruvate ferredoxin oxidoreductase alpha subunit